MILSLSCFIRFLAILLTLSQNLIYFARPVLAASQSWSFTSSADYTFDNTKIEFSSGQAQVKATSSWYNTSWSRRKAITVDNSNNANTLTNYQVLVTVTYDSDMNADFSDIRFTASDGTTLLDHWLEDSTASTTANFWVEVSSIAASTTTTIYMYYGNSGAADSSNVGNTFAYHDALTDTSGWSTFGTGTWSSTANNDSERGTVFDGSINQSHSGIYKTVSLPASYAVQLYAKDRWSSSNAGTRMGPLMDMQNTSTWLKPGFAKISSDGLRINDINGNVSLPIAPLTTVQDTATRSYDTWYKTQAIFKPATTYTANSTIVTESGADNIAQGLATDGSFIYSSGTGSTNGLAKYDRTDGSRDATTTHTPANEYYGGLAVVGDYVYAVVIDYLTTPGNVKTYIYRYSKSDLSGQTLVADISSSVGNGGNALAYKDGYWIVGETGGNGSDFNQHFYVFDSNWALVKTIQSPYYNDAGAQDATFKGNALYVTEHDLTVLIFNWNPETLSLTLIDATALPQAYNTGEGIAYDSVNDIFYVQSRGEKKIYSASFASSSNKRIVYWLPDSSNSYGVVSYDFASAGTATIFGVGAYRSGRASQLIVRQYSFPEPIYSTGSEATLYPTDSPTVRPASALSFTSVSAFTETATKNSGEIKYQLSNDNGTTWYWYSSGWTATSAGYTEANTASSINSNISSFPKGSMSFLFRAYLNSNGSQLVKLDAIDITYVNSVASSATSSTTDPPACTDLTPVGIPSLFQIQTTANSAKLYFTTISRNVSGYTIAYGFTPGEEKYATSINYSGSAWIFDTTINNLLSNTTYHFKVKAKNGCTAGGWSNNLSAKTSGLVEFNKLEFTSFELTPDTSAENTPDKAEAEVKEYSVRVKVTDTNKKPVGGAKVTIHSRVQEAVTGKDGIAEFLNIEPGEHKIFIAYNNFEGEQAVNLTGDVRDFNLNVTIQPKTVMFSSPAIIIIGILLLVIIALTITLVRTKAAKRWLKGQLSRLSLERRTTKLGVEGSTKARNRRF